MQGKEILKTHSRKWFKGNIGKIILLMKKDKSKIVFRLETLSMCEAHYSYQFQPFFQRYSLNLNFNNA